MMFWAEFPSYKTFVPKCLHISMSRPFLSVPGFSKEDEYLMGVVISMKSRMRPFKWQFKSTKFLCFFKIPFSSKERLSQNISLFYAIGEFDCAFELPRGCYTKPEPRWLVCRCWVLLLEQRFVLDHPATLRHFGFASPIRWPSAQITQYCLLSQWFYLLSLG